MVTEHSRVDPYRIFHIVDFLNRGGMESRILDLHRNLDRRRFQFDYYVESGLHGNYDEEVEQLGERVFYTERTGTAGSPNLRMWR